MRILVDSGSYHCLNVGDVAMLQTAIARLRRLWPDAVISAVTNAPALLARHCPGVTPIPLSGRVGFLTDRLLGRGHRLLPRTMQAALDGIETHIRTRWPECLGAIIAAKRAVTRSADAGGPRLWLDALRRADLFLVTGAGLLTDAFIENAVGVLDSIALAQRWNVATALMGQGIGPVRNDTLRRRMAAVLPRARLIAVRERRVGPGLLRSLGVASDRIAVTGDDAIEMANQSASHDLGDAIGVNLRMARYAAVEEGDIEVVRRAIQHVAASLSARLQPVPIAHHPDCHDGIAIRAVLTGYRATDGTVAELPTPAEAIAAVSRCRVVVTGSYHAAVFALAQGIPVVALARSPYYLDKFCGLADLFPAGCHVVVMRDGETDAQLEAAVSAAWLAAPRTRDALLRSAASQIASGQAAYRLLGTPSSHQHSL